jgi:hypothetical protein
LLRWLVFAVFIAILMAIMITILETIDIAIIEELQRPFFLCDLPRDVLNVLDDSLSVCLAGSYHRGLLFLLHKQTFLFLALFLS